MGETHWAQRRPRRGLWLLLSIVVLLLVAVGGWYGRVLLRAASVLYAFSERTPPLVVRWYNHYSRYPQSVQDLVVAKPGGGEMSLRVYTPEGLRQPPTIVLVHGAVQPGNRMEEVNRLAKALVQQGFRVVLPMLPEEANLNMAQSDVDTIADAIMWASANSGGEKVSAFGVSFGGALTIVAAESPKAKEHVRLILDIAGYNDLDTLARYYVHESVVGPDGKPYPAEGPEFGAILFLKQYLDEMVPAEDVVPLQQAILRLYESGRFPVLAGDPVLQGLTPAQQEMFMHLEFVDTPEVRQHYLALIHRHHDDFLALSPRSVLPHLDLPLYVLHARGDRQIPDGEVASMRTEVSPESDSHFLITPWMQHAMVRNSVPWRERLNVGQYVAEVLERAAGQ